MSKHFELMQQIEKEQVQEVSDSRVTCSDFTENGNQSESIWTNDEAQRLVQQLFAFQVKEPPRTVTFAGIDHGNGCSRISAAVAETLAKNNRGRRVCLVEANFRSPALPGMFGVPNHFGLTEALLRDEAVSQFAKPLPQQNLWLLSSGTLAVDSPSLLASEQLRTRIAELRQEFDFVIVDAPPLNRYSDGIVLGQLSDGLVLVIEANTTRREAAAAVTQNLHAAKVPILAAVLNKRTFPIPESIYKIL